MILSASNRIAGLVRLFLISYARAKWLVSIVLRTSYHERPFIIYEAPL